MGTAIPDNDWQGCYLRLLYLIPQLKTTTRMRAAVGTMCLPTSRPASWRRPRSMCGKMMNGYEWRLMMERVE